MTGLKIGRLGTHEMRKLEGDSFIVPCPGSCFKFHPEFIEFDREKLDRHIAVKGFSIRPALHVVLIGQLLIHCEECIQFIVIDMTVLESTSINDVVDAVKNLAPLPFMFLN